SVVSGRQWDVGCWMFNSGSCSWIVNRQWLSGGLINEARILPASSRRGHQDDNGNARRKSRRDVPSTTARFARGRSAAVATPSVRRREKNQTALQDAAVAKPPVASSPQTKT